MRNPSKNTIKQLARPANGAPPGWGPRHTNYYLFNSVGARLYVMSKHKIEHMDGATIRRYLTPAQRLKHAYYLNKDERYWH
jgi:hypothetical protein